MKNETQNKSRGVTFLWIFILIISILINGCAQTTPIEPIDTQPAAEPSATTESAAPQPEVEPSATTESAAPQPEAEPSATTESLPERQGGDLRIVWAMDVPIFDPSQEGRGTGRMVTNMVFRGLTKLDYQTGEPKPDIANDWSVSEDGLTWTFNLKQDVVFQNGEPLDADTVVANIERWIDPDFPFTNRTHVALIEGAQAIDPYTVEVYLSNPNPILPTYFGHGLLKLVSKGDIEEYGAELGLHLPTGTGPFKIVEFIPLQKIVLERWDGYNGPGAGEVYMDRIIFDTVPDASARTARLLAGEADINFYETVQAVSSYEAEPGLEILSGPSLRQWLFHINANQPHLGDIRVRQALNHAVDQDGIVNAVFQGFAFTRTGLIGLGHFGATDVEPFYEYDPEKALALMEEAGWTLDSNGQLRDEAGNLFELRLDITTGGVYGGDDGIAEAVSGFYEAIGIKMNVVASDRTTFFDLSIYDPEAPERTNLSALPSQSAQQDGAAYLSILYSEAGLTPNCCNWAQYRNEEAWEMIKDAVAEPDLPTRARLIGEAQQRVWDDVPTIILPQLAYVVGKSTRVQGLNLSPNDEAHTLAFTWFED